MNLKSYPSILAFIAVCLLYFVKPVNSQKSRQLSDVQYNSLSQKLAGWLIEHDVPAVSVTIIQNGKISYSHVFGQQSPDKPVNDSTLFLSASIAKPMTGEVFLRLVSQGKVSLDEPMANFWIDPDIASDNRVYQLTPRHVLTHETGFKNWRYMTEGKLRFERDPGIEMGYSGEGLQYLVRFLEKKFDQPFNQLSQEVLFDPIGMKNASFVKQDWYKGRLAWPKFPDGKWKEPRVREKALGAGGLHITTEEYAKFMISTMDGDYISEDLRKQQLTIGRNQYEQCISSSSSPSACPEKLGFGLGWYIYEFDDERVIAHTGANNGERTLAIFSPERKFGLVVMTNGANGNHIIYKVAKMVGIHPKFIAIEKPDYVKL